SIFPVTAKPMTPPEKSPCLEYRMWLSSTGAVEVAAFVGPCLNFAPERPVRLGVSLDDEPVQVVTLVPKGYVAGDGNPDWEESVKDGVRRARSKHTVATRGSHTLRIWMVDPGVALQKIVMDMGGVKPSYLGPPESSNVR